MNSGRKAGGDAIGEPGQLRQLAITGFGSCQVRGKTREPKARGTPFQSMQPFADAGGRLRRKIAQGCSQLFTERQQARLTQQGEQLGNTVLIDRLHGALPR